MHWLPNLGATVIISRFKSSPTSAYFRQRCDSFHNVIIAAVAYWESTLMQRISKHCNHSLVHLLSTAIRIESFKCESEGASHWSTVYSITFFYAVTSRCKLSLLPINFYILCIAFYIHLPASSNEIGYTIHYIAIHSLHNTFMAEHHCLDILHPPCGCAVPQLLPHNLRT